jgi:hypothetical protein
MLKGELWKTFDIIMFTIIFNLVFVGSRSPEATPLP